MDELLLESLLNEQMTLTGFVFRQMDNIIHKVKINDFTQLSTFFVGYVCQAFEKKWNCAIFNDNYEIVFYLQNGKMVYPTEERENFTTLLEMMSEG